MRVYSRLECSNTLLMCMHASDVKVYAIASTAEIIIIKCLFQFQRQIYHKYNIGVHIKVDMK